MKKYRGRLWKSDVYEDPVYFYKDRQVFFADINTECDEKCVGYTISEEDAYCIGVFDRSHRTLVHEAAHLAIFIAEDRGISTDSENSEAFCYLLDSIYAAGRRLGLLSRNQPTSGKTP